MKKIFALVAIATMMFGFVACNNNNTEATCSDTVATDTVEVELVDSVSVDSICAE